MLCLWLSLKIWLGKGKGKRVSLHSLPFTISITAYPFRYSLKNLSFEEFITAGPIYQGQVRLRLRAVPAPPDKQAHFP